MKKQPTNTEKDRLDPMSNTRNYGAGNEGEDILEREDNDEGLEEEPEEEDVGKEDEEVKDED